MDVVLKQRGGHNLVMRPEARPRWYPEASVEVAHFELWASYATSTIEEAWLVGTFKPGQSARIPWYPDVDSNLRFYLVSVSASGTRDVSRLEDAVQASLPLQREVDAPVIGQNSPATTAAVEIGITGFTRFARHRRVTVSARADMSDPLELFLFDSDDYTARELPRYFILQRDTSVGLTTEAGSPLEAEDSSSLEIEVLPATVYVTVAHSGGTSWTPESNILLVTFAGESTPGSTGAFDPTPRDEAMLSL